MSLYARERLWNYFDAIFSHELNETHPRAETPSWIKTKLLPHQQASLAAALAIERAKTEGIDVPAVPGDPYGGKLFSSYGVLADKVGSGKSLTMLALLRMPPPAAVYNDYVIRGQRYNDGRDVGLLRQRNQLLTHNNITLRPISTSLIIVPHALIGQWETYITRDTTLNVKIIKKKNDASDEKLMDAIETYDAVLLSNTMWSSFRNAHRLGTICWRRIFVDEADSIGFANDVDELHAQFYWFITASYMNILFANGCWFNIETHYTPLETTTNRVKNLVYAMQGAQNYLATPGIHHNNLVKIMASTAHTQGTLGINAATLQATNLIVRNSESFIEQSFPSPVITHTDIMCLTPQNIRMLDSLISPEMMERLNAGDLHGALGMIGSSTHTEDEITAAVTESLTKELEKARQIHVFKKNMEYSSEAAKTHAMEACEQKIASLENRIQAIHDRIKKAKDQTCPICYMEVTNASVTPCCQQLFCFGCLCESLKRVAACPLCRTRIADLKEVQVIGDASTTPVARPTLLNKSEEFVKFLLANPSGRILMFSGYDASFVALETLLTKHKITYSTLNGSEARITKILRDFKDGKYRVLFLNARNMGAGLNIESATHVVLYHRMNSELEKQIIGRANRLGRTEPLDVVHLLHDNELHNRISHA